MTARAIICVTPGPFAFVGEVLQWNGPKPPEGYRFADGSLLSILDHADLYAVIGDDFAGFEVVDVPLPGQWWRKLFRQPLTRPESRPLAIPPGMFKLPNLNGPSNE